MLSIIEPYDLDKNLGRAYNREIRHCPDWVLIKDYDVLFLLPETIKDIHEYIKLFPTTGMFTCFTNRIANKDQLLNGEFSDNDKIRDHINLARLQRNKLYQATELKGDAISGMVMVIKKSTWDEIKFSEDGLCLGVDNDYSRRLMQAGKKILRMDGIYAFHIYRMEKGIRNKDHLYV